ncbi:hypothetical protein F0L74_05895 [Chitinophaga agrisoli]|uniref:Uncharacterized protein n=1 Tax=Chitinophaga agrisoli TaxID=2607653 RepID=A0A5B2W3Q8_9BACT|nr:hypothetical protein [Chitinophaga agrisoli]KAA2245488.1 hypothetical protein F0L74_05895 [Chitinophaga agrisoli]
MKEHEEISNRLAEFASKFGPTAIVQAKVTAVNNDDTIAVVFLEGGSVNDCRLKAIIKDGNKVILIPAVGSIVLVGRIDNSDDYVVIAVHEISEIVQLVGGAKYSHNADGFLFKKDGDDLLSVFEMIIESVLKIVVMQGTNPDYAKLQQALTKAQNILRNGT